MPVDRNADFVREASHLLKSNAEDAARLAERIRALKDKASDKDKAQYDALLQEAEQHKARTAGAVKGIPLDLQGQGANRTENPGGDAPDYLKQARTSVVPGGAPGAGVPVMGDTLWRAPSGDMHTTVEHLAPAGAPSYPASEVQAPSGGPPQTPLPARVVGSGGPTPEEQAKLDKQRAQEDAAQAARKQDPNLNPPQPGGTQQAQGRPPEPNPTEIRDKSQAQQAQPQNQPNQPAKK